MTDSPYLITESIEAAADRHGSAHGQKDARDIIRILLLAKQQGFNAERSILFMRDDHLARLKLIVNGPEFIALVVCNRQRQRGQGVAAGVHASVCCY